MINKGADDGVYRGQALVDAHGVLGQIVEVNPKTSVALLITDANHGIPVEINRTGLQTIALGRGDAQSLSLPFLSSNAYVKVGDLLMWNNLSVLHRRDPFDPRTRRVMHRSQIKGDERIA